MAQSNQKNHRLYEVITPYFSDIVREHMDTENRIYITKCEMSKDGRSLLVFVGFSTYTKEDFLQVKKFAPAIRKHIANLQIIGRVPEIYFKRDTGESLWRTIEDILQEIRKSEI
jgi:ribosome-binding factor A